jgi:predicted Zn-ribbon and HTH transcriptional regulator
MYLMKPKACLRCGAKFKPDKLLRDPSKNLCPYCDSVHFGEPDAKWLPSLKGDDIDAKGFHRI